MTLHELTPAQESTMNPTPFDFCDKHSACQEGRAFAVQYPSMADAWDNCPNLDWMMWILAKLDKPLDNATARLFACWCVRETPLADGRKVWDLLTDERSRNAVVVAERFANGNATLEELTAARAAARAAAGDAAGAAWAAWAAWAAAGDAARAARDAARDAWDAARAAAGDAAWAAAGDAARAAQCNHLRTICPNPFLL